MRAHDTMLCMCCVYMEAYFKKESKAIPWQDSLLNVISIPAAHAPPKRPPIIIQPIYTIPTLPHCPTPFVPSHPIPHPKPSLYQIPPLATAVSHHNTSTPSLFRLGSSLVFPSIAITCLRSIIDCHFEMHTFWAGAWPTEEV